MSAVWLLALYCLSAAEPDQAVLTVMRRAAPDVYHFQILKRVAVSAELDLVVALGRPGNGPAEKGDSGWWGDQTTLGVLLQDRNQPSKVYQIAMSKGEGDCRTRVERATATEVVLSCEPEKGACGPNHKFVYSIRSKALVKQMKYSPFALRRIFVSGGHAILIGSNTEQLVAIQYNPFHQPVLDVLEGAPAQHWIKQIPTNIVTVGVEMKRETLIEPKPFKPVRFGPDERFTLTENVDRNNVVGGQLVVTEKVGGRTKYYPLPQSRYDEFAELRRSRVKDGYTREATTISEAIGAWQIVNGTLWLAKTFYDGEGSTGIGGFGYFDTRALKYQIYSPPQIVGWSTTAMFVDSNAVWLGLVYRGEYGDTGGGLLRYDRTTQNVERFGLHECDIANKMTSFGDHLLLATESGTAVVKGHTLHRFFVDQTTTGRWQILESTPEN